MYPSDDSLQATAATFAHLLPAPSVSERRFPASHSAGGDSPRRSVYPSDDSLQATASVDEICDVGQCIRATIPCKPQLDSHDQPDCPIVYPSGDSLQATASSPPCSSVGTVYPSGDSLQATAECRGIETALGVYPSGDSLQATALAIQWKCPLLVYPSGDSLQATARNREPGPQFECIRAAIPCKPQLRARGGLSGQAVYPSGDSLQATASRSDW